MIVLHMFFAIACMLTSALLPIGMVAGGLINIKADIPLCAISMICACLCCWGMSKSRPDTHREIVIVSVPGIIGATAAITSILL